MERITKEYRIDRGTVLTIESLLKDALLDAGDMLINAEDDDEAWNNLNQWMNDARKILRRLDHLEEV